eukprot:1159183-Pelagomonas_calceolata.AAC.28
MELPALKLSWCLESLHGVQGNKIQGQWSSSKTYGIPLCCLSKPPVRCLPCFWDEHLHVVPCCAALATSCCIRFLAELLWRRAAACGFFVERLVAPWWAALAMSSCLWFLVELLVHLSGQRLWLAPGVRDLYVLGCLSLLGAPLGGSWCSSNQPLLLHEDALPPDLLQQLQLKRTAEELGPGAADQGEMHKCTCKHRRMHVA